MSIRKQHCFVHYYCHHTVRYIQIFFTTPSEKLALTYKCAPESVCLHINICIFLQTSTVCVTNCTYNVILCVTSCKIYTIVAQCMFLLCGQRFTTQNYISCRVFTYVGILPRCLECLINVKCN